MTPEQRQAVERALKAYWETRAKASSDQQARGASDTGERGTVTSGKHLHHVAQLLAYECIDAGAPENAVYYQEPEGETQRPKGSSAAMTRGFTLPGYFRPTKMWDLVVRAEGRPVVAIELKSQNGPSYANNANNRVEEAIGNSYDLKRAVEESLIPNKPWLGFVYIVEDDINSNLINHELATELFHVDDEVFNQTSHLDRVQILGQRLIKDGLYNSVWMVKTSRPYCPNGATSENKKNKCPLLTNRAKKAQLQHVHEFSCDDIKVEETGFARFVASLKEVVRFHYPDGSPKNALPERPLHADPGLF